MRNMYILSRKNLPALSERTSECSHKQLGRIKYRVNRNFWEIFKNNNSPLSIQYYLITRPFSDFFNSKPILKRRGNSHDFSLKKGLIFSSVLKSQSLKIRESEKGLYLLNYES